MSSAGRHAPDDRRGPVADVEVAGRIEDDEAGHVCERGVGVGRDHAIDVLHTRARVDAQNPAVHVGNVEPASGVEGHAQEAHRLCRRLPRDEDRVGPGLDGPAGVEAEGPDLVACIEESIEARVRGADVQRAPVHREAARVPGVTERCEHLNVADRTAQCLCLGWSGSHPQSHDYRQQRCPRHEFAYGRMPHCGVLLLEAPVGRTPLSWRR